MIDLYSCFSNNQCLPRLEPLHNHLTKLFVNAGPNTNGTGLVIKSLKFQKPNNLMKEMNTN